jgi:hypothetical protein
MSGNSDASSASYDSTDGNMSTTDREAWSQWAKANPNPRAPVAKANKYHATKVQIDGHWFDSQREAARYQELKFLVVAGEIAALEVHPGFPLMVLMVPDLTTEGAPLVFHTIGWYHADFQYRNLRTGNVVVEDVKSKPTKTEAYKLRKKFVEAQYGITIAEIG